MAPSFEQIGVLLHPSENVVVVPTEFVPEGERARFQGIVRVDGRVATATTSASSPP